MTCHHLKTWTEPFEAIQLGLKGFEYRSEADRRFEVGDLLCLEDYDPELSRHTGNAMWRVVTFVLRGVFGVPEGFAVLSIEAIYVAERLGVEIEAADLAHFHAFETQRLRELRA